MKTKINLFVLSFVLFFSSISYSQQWVGSLNTNGIIHRDGNVSIGTFLSGARLTIDMNDNGSTQNGIVLKRSNGIYGGTEARLNISSDGGVPGLSIAMSYLGLYSRAVFITRNRLVGIGNTLPSQKLHVSGNVLANSYLTVSDSKFKLDIHPINAVDRLYTLRGVSYHMNQQDFTEQEFDDKKHYGFIAQEVREVYPEIVHEDDHGNLSVDYLALIPVLVEGIKKQQSELENQKKTIDLLKLELGLEDKGTQTEIAFASLDQNTPNPFDSKTVIKYYIPKETQSAQILLYDLNGTQVKSFDLSSMGHESIEIRANELKPGMYIYTLIVEGNEISSKRLIITK